MIILGGFGVQTIESFEGAIYTSGCNYGSAYILVASSWISRHREARENIYVGGSV